jgi:hypothetical protein
MRNLFWLAFLCFSIQAHSQERSGPFGFEAGMTREQIIQVVGLGAVKESDADTLILTAAPKAHPDFGYYALKVSPGSGLMKIIAMGKDIPTDAFGSEMKNAYTGLSDQLAAVYGKPNHRLDRLNNGSIWFGPDDWMMALLKGDRMLACSWMEMPLPDKISFIRLEVVAKSKDTGFLSLTYEFEGFAEYMNQKK